MCRINQKWERLKFEPEFIVWQIIQTKYNNWIFFLLRLVIRFFDTHNLKCLDSIYWKDGFNLYEMHRFITKRHYNLTRKMEGLVMVPDCVLFLITLVVNLIWIFFQNFFINYISLVRKSGYFYWIHMHCRIKQFTYA